MPVQVFAVLLMLASASTPQERPVACVEFLIGQWVGQGDVSGFGPPVKVDNAYEYNRDGSFLTVNRYLGQDKRWHEQRLSGQWSVTAAPFRRTCVLVLVSDGSGMSASSTSNIEMIGTDTFRSQGFDMKRVRK